MDPIDEALKDYLALRDRVGSAQLATLGNEQKPEASHAPLVWHEGSCYLFLSELASHTQNLKRNAALGLLLVEDEAAARNPFARRRISLQGSATLVARDSEEFEPVLDAFRRRFGKVMEMIEPLPDFRLFRVDLNGGRFIRGFGQAYELTGQGYETLRHIGPGK